MEVTSIGSTCSVRKIGSQSLAAATPAPVTRTAALSAATAGRRIAVRQRPRPALGADASRAGAAEAAEAVASLAQAASVSTSLVRGAASAASTSCASARAVVQRAQAGGAAGDVVAVVVGHAGRLVDQSAQDALTRVTHGGSAP